MSVTASNTVVAKPTLTTHLQSLSTPRPYSAAVEHEFLTAAGHRTLSPTLLSLYLCQDRLYAAHAYPRFIGRLLASIPFSPLHGLDSPQERFHARVLKTLSYALENVAREVGFFGETARTYDLRMDWEERKQTRDYTAEMARVGVEGDFEEMLVFLWAMERVSADLAPLTFLRSSDSRAVTLIRCACNEGRFILTHGRMRDL